MIDLGVSGASTGIVGRQGAAAHSKKQKQNMRLPAIKNGPDRRSVGAGSAINGLANEIDAKFVKARGMQRGALGNAARDARQKAQQEMARANNVQQNMASSFYPLEVNSSDVGCSDTVDAPVPMQLPQELAHEPAGIAFASRDATAQSAAQKVNSGGVVFDVDAMKAAEPASPKARAPERKPKGMQRAKQWTSQVENMFRFQLAGWRDVFEYLTVHEEPAMWEEEGFVRCLQNRNGNFMYFRKTRECENKHLPKVKLYSY